MALTDSLISFWALEEASGTRNDSHSTNHLTDNNTVASAAGKVGTAGDFEKDNSESLSIASNGSLLTGDIDFSAAGWVQFESKVTSAAGFGKEGTIGNYEWVMYYDVGSDRLRLWVSNDGTNGITVSADNLGSPAVGIWYFVVVWHDSVNNLMGISVNDGTPNTQAYSNGVFAGAGPFMVGADEASTTYFWDGLIDQVGFWKRVLTAAEITQLYNSGSGLSYAAMQPRRWLLCR